MHPVVSKTLTIVAVVAPLCLDASEDWLSWRGEGNRGVSETAEPPLTWSETSNIDWKVPIEGEGTSSPIVVGDRVFITTARDTGEIHPDLPRPEDQPERVFGITFPNTHYEMILLCIDRGSGKTLWRRVAKTLIPHEGHHRDASFASGSPVSDGENVYCWFGSAGCFAFDLDGNLLWERNLGEARMGASLGEGSSPVVHQGKVVLVRDHAGQSRISVLDANDGSILWQRDRDEENAWATPVIAQFGGRTQVITSATNRVRAYDLASGEVIWHAGGLTHNCAPCPILDGEMVYLMSGYRGHALLAIPISGQGDVTDQIQWRTTKGTPYVPSAMLVDGRLFFTRSNQGILSCLAARTGKPIIERQRIEGLGDLYASPVGAAGRVYLIGRRGSAVVLSDGGPLDQLATNRLADQFHASPALSGDRLLLRGMRFLYCLRQGGTFSSNPSAIQLSG
ncbi:MAG: PQQ-binding-like beta-propeller repeat protein, partial [Verrucomicrobiota bacterium]